MSKSDRWYSSQTQRSWACEALLSGRVLTTQAEIGEVRGWRLAAIIHALKDEYGGPIESAYRGAANIKPYWLQSGTDPAKLQYPPCARHLAEGGAQ